MVYVRGFLVWLIIIFAEAVHGTLRGLFLAPLVGDFKARQIAVFSGTVIIFIIALLTVKWIKADRLPQLVAVGFIWLLCTVVFEFSLGYYILNFPWERMISDYNMAEGGLLPIGLFMMTLTPALAGKLRGTI